VLRDGIITAGTATIGQAAKKISPAYGGHMMQLPAATNWRHDSDFTAPDQINFMTLISNGVNSLSGLERWLFQTRAPNAA
jgi:hypothetical protein